MIHGITHTHTDGDHHGATALDMADGMTHFIMEACILLGVGDTVDGTHLSIAVGIILGIILGIMVATDTDMDMEVVFMTDTIQDSPIIDREEAQVFTDRLLVEDQVLPVHQDAQVVLQEVA